MHIDNLFNPLGGLSMRIPSFSGLLSASDYNAKTGHVKSMLSEAKGHGRVEVLNIKRCSSQDITGWPYDPHN